MTVDELRAALNADDRSRVGRRLTDLQVSARDPSGRAERVTIQGDRPITLRGEDLRAILNRTVGDRGIQSTRFTLSRVGASFRFEGQGFGHGVGLCQIGAAARARRGDSLDDILAAYYKGATLIRP
jgi:stage II sporulation protein D